MKDCPVCDYDTDAAAVDDLLRSDVDDTDEPEPAVIFCSVSPRLSRWPAEPEMAWSRLVRRLATVLKRLEEGEYLILSTRRDSGRYVQFAAQGEEGMRAEAVSNVYLPNDDKLTQEQEGHLLELGWLAPTHLPRVDALRHTGSPNYYLDLPLPVRCHKLAALAARTLREVYDVEHPRGLRYNAFSGEGEPLTYPSLGLAREE